MSSIIKSSKDNAMKNPRLPEKPWSDLSAWGCLRGPSRKKAPFFLFVYK